MAAAAAAAGVLGARPPAERALQVAEVSDWSEAEASMNREIRTFK